MNENNMGGWNFPDLSNLIDTLNSIRETIRPVMEGVQRLREAVRPLIETVEHNIERISAVGWVMTEASRRMSVVEKLGEAQFVYWERMSQDFVDSVLASDNLNKTLRQYIQRDKNKWVYETIEKTRQSDLISKYQRLYDQAIIAYEKGYSDLAVVGLTTIFDGLLSSASQNPTHRFSPRIEIIKNKIEVGELLTHKECVMITLMMTLERTLESFTHFTHFSGKEPKGLNRHWIAHGRSTRRKTKLDCIKMLNLIYGIVLVSEISDSSSTLSLT